MKHVPVAKFKDRVSEFIAEAEAGDEVVITRHGKVAARLVPPEIDKSDSRREAVHGLFALGRELRAKYGAASQEEIKRWIDEDRR